MEWLTKHVLEIGVTSGIFLGLGALLKWLPVLLETKVQVAILELFKMGDAADDAFLIAAIKWAEAKLGPGTGEAKATLVVNKILGMLPVQYRLFVSEKSRLRAIELFQQSFDRVMKTMHDQEVANDK